MTFSIYGKTVLLPQRKAFWGDVIEEDKVTKSPLYRYVGSHTPVVHDWNPVIGEIHDLLKKATKQHCNHCVQNMYETGQNYIGLHRDKDRDFRQGASVLTVSLSEVRQFHLQADNGSHTVDIMLQPGSLFCLGPETKQRLQALHSQDDRGSDTQDQPHILRHQKCEKRRTEDPDVE